MYIILGNDIYYKQVRIYDTKDCTIEMVSHKKMYKYIELGVKVYGLSEDNIILCQALDLFDELLPFIKNLYAKALVLKVNDIVFRNMLYKLVAPYGLALTETDIRASLLSQRIEFRLTGHSLKLDSMTVSKLHSIKLEKQFKDLPLKARYMLEELAKIPIFTSYNSRVRTIEAFDEDSYIVKTDETKLYVLLENIGNIKASLHNIDARTIYLYEKYIEDVKGGVFPERQYYIRQLIINYRNINGFLSKTIYERRN